MDAQESRKKRRLAGLYQVPIFLRATEEEARQIDRNAKTAGQNRSRFLAELGAAEGAADKLPAPPSPELVAVLEALMFQLRKAGVNLNQLAHRENSAGFSTLTSSAAIGGRIIRLSTSASESA